MCVVDYRKELCFTVKKKLFFCSICQFFTYLRSESSSSAYCQGFPPKVISFSNFCQSNVLFSCPSHLQYCLPTCYLLSKYVLFSKNEHSDPTGKDSYFVTILQGWNLFSAIRIKFMLNKTATQEKSSNEFS